MIKLDDACGIYSKLGLDYLLAIQYYLFARKIVDFDCETEADYPKLVPIAFD